jgi:hypothetical protein
MDRAFKQACARLQLTGATPVVELVAVRILELVRDGEFDTDRLTEATVRTVGAPRLVDAASVKADASQFFDDRSC